jgi:5'-nucleotidase
MPIQNSNLGAKVGDLNEYLRLIFQSKVEAFLLLSCFISFKRKNSRMSVPKPLIFVTNDDGIFAKGIATLVEAVKPFGEVVVIAPDKPQSGMGHAITINSILRMNPSDIFGDIKAFTCSGTPVDCVKLGIYELMKRKPDLIVSGINHGDNASTNVLYSGTMSAAVEGAIEGIPSIGFSLADYHADADFSGAKIIVQKMVQSVLENQMPKGTCLNVNVPSIPANEIKGIKICRGAHAMWADFFDKRMDQFGNPYFWLSGQFEAADKTEDSDLWALEHGFASIVPIQFDMTAYQAINELKNWNIEL